MWKLRLYECFNDIGLEVLAVNFLDRAPANFLHQNRDVFHSRIVEGWIFNREAIYTVCSEMSVNSAMKFFARDARETCGRRSCFRNFPRWTQIRGCCRERAAKDGPQSKFWYLLKEPVRTGRSLNGDLEKFIVVVSDAGCCDTSLWRAMLFPSDYSRAEWISPGDFIAVVYRRWFADITLWCKALPKVFHLQSLYWSDDFRR